MLTMTHLSSFILASSVLVVITTLLLLIATNIPHISKAYAHFIGGETKTIDNYQILFLLSPPKPVVGDNSTKLNFSVLDKEENTDVKLIFAALTIKEKDTDTIVHQVPYKLYEFGDITFPYTFKNNTDYEAVLEARISGDPKYESTPLTASFYISAVNPTSTLPFDQLMTYYVIPITIVLGVIVIAVTLLRRNIKQ
jgi:hypothetical protein